MQLGDEAEGFLTDAALEAIAASLVANGPMPLRPNDDSIFKPSSRPVEGSCMSPRLGLDPDLIHSYELYVRVLARPRVVQAKSSWTHDMMRIT